MALGPRPPQYNSPVSECWPPPPETGGCFNTEGPQCVEPAERMMKWFEYKHLPPHLQSVSIPFHGLAYDLTIRLEPGPERTVALRKLLEAKDAAVRASLHPGG